MKSVYLAIFTLGLFMPAISVAQGRETPAVKPQAAQACCSPAKECCKPMAACCSPAKVAKPSTQKGDKSAESCCKPAQSCCDNGGDCCNPKEAPKP